MKKLNKKGFTIVELVIVIAVIAILAAVLIPTFSSVISNANKSSAMQACTAAYTEALAKAYENGTIDATEVVTVDGGWTFTFTGSNGSVSGCTVSCTNAKYSGYSFTYSTTENNWSVSGN